MSKVFRASASGVATSMAITSLALYNISRASLLQDNKATWSVGIQKRGSNKHIKGCKRASQQLKFEISALNNRERQRTAELASFHDMESTSRALDKEERKIESAFPGSIRGEPSSAYAGGLQGSDVRPPTSNFSSPSSVANIGTHSDSNPIFSQTLP
ncbi:hypothetical protein R1flu_022306 [Riccia fluitans]|uniref:ATP synthase protein MI25 n=1 Tax=Riccia fluitans TaxID=41844 RepID=A0ABD1ZRU0_9MARC